MNFLSVENLSKSYGEKQLFEGITFGIDQGQHVAIVAKNGAGKSTLMKIITGKEEADRGTVTFRKDLRIGFLEQDSQFDPEQTILEVVLAGNDPVTVALRNYEQGMINEVSPEKLSDLLEEVTLHNAWDHENQVKEILSKLGLTDVTKKTKTLSGGQKKRLALAQVLIGKPELMILDEPTNHLDLDMIEWLEVFLSSGQITLFMVTHDRYFLERVCDEILELEEGNLFRYKGSYSYFLEKKEERTANEQANIEKAKNLFRKELDWMRRQPKARSVKAKSRIDAFYEVSEKANKQIKEDKIEFNVNMSRVGGKILEFHRVGKSFGDKKILEHFDYIFKKGEKIGIVGPNGIGKSTFLNMIMEKEKVDSGKISAGETMVFGYYSQEGIKLDNDKRIIEVIKEIAEFIPMAGGKKLTAAQLLERFMFPVTMQYQNVSKLSGGEKRRLYLLTILMKNPNFLILDEPTNDLDVFTLSALEDYLESFEGCVLVVTHDRYFMDRLVDHIFVFEGEGKIKDYPGNYTQYREWMDVKEEKEAKENKKKVENSRTEDSVKVVEEESELSSTGNTSVSNNNSSSNKKSSYAEASEDKKKLSFKEKFELEQLDKEIPLLEAKKKNLEAELSKLDIDHVKIISITEELGQVISDLDAKSLRWLELSE